MVVLIKSEEMRFIIDQSQKPYRSRKGYNYKNDQHLLQGCPRFKTKCVQGLPGVAGIFDNEIGQVQVW